MIRINLLPSKKQAKGKAARAPGAGVRLSVGGGAGLWLMLLAVVVFLGIAGYYGKTVYDAQAVAKSKKDALDRTKAELVKEVKKLEKETEGLASLNSILQNEIGALKALSPADRVIWAEKLRQLAELTPENIFFTSLVVKESVQESLTEESQRALKQWQEEGSKGPQPPQKKKAMVTQTLEIDGIAYAKDYSERPQLMLEFYNVLKTFAAKRPGNTQSPTGKETPFMSSFAGGIEILPWTREKVDDIEVTKFAFKIPTATREG